MKTRLALPRLTDAMHYLYKWHGEIESERMLKDLLFLADKLYWARTGTQYTEANWTRANNGPHAVEVLQLLSDCDYDHAGHGPVRDMDAVFEMCLDEVAHKKYRTRIKDMVYDSEFITMQFGDKLLSTRQVVSKFEDHPDANPYNRIVFPHCDARILHPKGTCTYCDGSGLHEIRSMWKIACTGDAPVPGITPCPSQQLRTLDQMHAWPGNRARKDNE